MRCLLILFLTLLGVAANTECIWAVGRLVCRGDQSKVVSAVIEIWDKDGPKNKAREVVDADDLAGVTVVEDEDGLFKAEGCASDFDWLGPLHRNRPEFYFKIRHNCRTARGDENELELHRGQTSWIGGCGSSHAGSQLWRGVYRFPFSYTLILTIRWCLLLYTRKVELFLLSLDPNYSITCCCSFKNS